MNRRGRISSISRVYPGKPCCQLRALSEAKRSLPPPCREPRDGGTPSVGRKNARGRPPSSRQGLGAPGAGSSGFSLPDVFSPWDGGMRTDPRAAQLAPGSRPPAHAVSSFQVRGFRKAQPKALGTIHIFTGIIHICFGIILTVSEYGTPSIPVASGVFFWLGLLLLVSGSLLVESEKRDNISLVKTCCVVNMGVILSTLVATLVHTTAIAHNIPGCDTNTPYQAKAEWCFNAGNKVLSNGLDSMFVIFCLLEFCAAVAALAFGYDAVKQHNYTRMLCLLRLLTRPARRLRFSHMIQDKALRASWARKMKERQERKLVRDLARQLQEGKQREREGELRAALRSPGRDRRFSTSLRPQPRASACIPGFGGPGVNRSLCLSPGPGPFPGVIDLFGGAGGLIEFRAGLLASRGFAVLALAFFAYDDLPRTLAQLDLEYFEEAAELLLRHPKVRGPGLGVVGVSKGAEVALAMAAFLPQVAATVWINGTAFLHGNPLVYKDLRIPPIPYYTERVIFTEVGALDNSAIFADPRDPAYSASAIPAEKVRGKVLFVVGEADRSFNSKLFAELAMARMPPERCRL
ncbi:PREDICTED: uncharacterized protein LOC103895438, partial [Aptenodytes forsteri]|uniref:uncharacterized protein LOC103895438 n=1 Tax=Aptenodytes forsteri TaxID=9233 RepID=UPI000904A970